MARYALLLAAVLSIGACATQGIPDPMVGQTRYLCCNLWYERTTIPDVNYEVGALLPVGTPVTITGLRGNEVTFEAAGHPPITVVLKYGRRNMDMHTFVDRVFVQQNPRTELNRLPAKTRQAIESGVVQPGMTRKQVLMALGYPPAHRTPSLESPQWTYWRNRWSSFVVNFDGDRVSSVSG